MPVCFSVSFTALALLFRSLIHFELNFVYSMNKGPPLWHWVILGSQHYLLTISFPHWMISITLLKIIWHRGLFLNSQFSSIELHVWVCGSTSPPNLFLFFKIILIICGPAQLHMNFRINLCQVLQRSPGVLIGLHWICSSLWGLLP